MELDSSHIDHTVPCFDPDCHDEAGHPSVAEPEQDGDVSFYACRTCGGEFGYRRQRPAQAAPSPGACPAGITHHPTAEAHQHPPPLLQIGTRHASAP